MKLAIVIPWFGRELKGGAEQHAWQIASRLAARGHQLEVLTTCCRSHQDDWETNHLPSGIVREPEGFTVRRFPVTSRARAAFDRVCGDLHRMPAEMLKLGLSPIDPDDAQIFCNELIKTPRLLEFLSAEKENYDRFICLPYLYGPVIKAIEILGERAVLQPCLHDEAYAYLPAVAQCFRQAAKILFISEGEQQLALRLFGPGIWERSRLVGGGVEAGTEDSILPRGKKDQIEGERYVLYLGRKDAGKNVPLLLQAFNRFREVRPNSNLQLLLAGNGEIESADGGAGHARDLGLVSEERKTELLQGCTALFQPSQNESFSRVVMEAWMHGKPVAAHAACLATAVAVKRAGGGWLAATESEWANVFVEVDRSSHEQLSTLGEKGRQYAVELTDWGKVIDRYEQALGPEGIVSRKSGSDRSSSPRQIDQFLPNLSYGDAISNFAIWIRNQLREAGFASRIYARYIDERVAHECSVFSPAALQTSDAAIYHHSIGTEITSHLANFRKPKCLIYHNITPAEFFDPFSAEFAAILNRGREDLQVLARHFQLSFGVSNYNASELRESGFENPGVIPLPIDPSKWNFAPHEGTMAEMQDGRTNLLFVGRIAPNKRQDDLLRAFDYYLEHDPDARLTLAGKIEEGDPYALHIRNLIIDRNLQGSVILTDRISDQMLAAYYRTAHLFWSMSEHEGFCVPLVEAMWFDVPILAYKSSAIPETLGTAGLLFTSKDDLRGLAALAYLLVTQKNLRESITLAQRKERERFRSEVIRQTLRKAVEPLLS